MNSRKLRREVSFRRLACAGAMCAAMGGLAELAGAATPVQWTVGSGGNDHYYERIDQTGLTFAQAETDAAALTFNGWQGHLLILDTADYSSELDFVFNNVYTPGVTTNEFYWAGAFLPDGSSTWSWIDGSTVPSSISNTWDVDHAEGPGDEGGGFYETGSETVWDYIASNSTNLAAGYIVEFEPAVPEPATLGALVAGGGLLLLRRRRR